jgi:hypothetical protein
MSWTIHQTAFGVDPAGMPILNISNPGPNKIRVIKLIRDTVECTLKDAKDVIDGEAVIEIPPEKVLHLEESLKSLGVTWTWEGSATEFWQLLRAAIAWRSQKPSPPVTSESQALDKIVYELQKQYAPETLEPRSVWERLMEDD